MNKPIINPNNIPDLRMKVTTTDEKPEIDKLFSPKVKKSLIYIIGMVFIFFAILFNQTYGYPIHTINGLGIKISMTLVFIVSITFLLWILTKYEKLGDLEIFELDASIYYSKFIDFIGFILAGFAIAFSILWTDVSTKHLLTLISQSILFMFFVMYVCISLFIIISNKIRLQLDKKDKMTK